MAGLFALLYGVFSFADGIATSVREDSQTKLSKQIAIEKGNLTYRDSRGWERFVETDDYCQTCVNRKNGHRVIECLNNKRLFNGIILYDYTQQEIDKENEKLERAIEQAKAKGFKYVKWYFPTISCGDVTGIEVDTRKKYVVDKGVFTNTYVAGYLEDELTDRRNVQGCLSGYYKVKKCKVITFEDYEERMKGAYVCKED